MFSERHIVLGFAARISASYELDGLPGERPGRHAPRQLG
jgi:hypothetical protein